MPRTLSPSHHPQRHDSQTKRGFLRSNIDALLQGMKTDAPHIDGVPTDDAGFEKMFSDAKLVRDAINGVVEKHDDLHPCAIISAGNFCSVVALAIMAGVDPTDEQVRKATVAMLKTAAEVLSVGKAA